MVDRLLDGLILKSTSSLPQSREEGARRGKVGYSTVPSANREDSMPTQHPLPLWCSHNYPQ